MAPRLSIGLPVYNGEMYLEEAIDSLLSQTYEDFELIICDNASTDRTEEICRKYAAVDSRVRYSRNPTNIGGMNNANLTFRLARGEYFRWAAHDDRCAPTMLERLIEEFDKHPDVTVCCAAAVSIDSHGVETGLRYPTEGTAAEPNQRYRQLMTDHACEATYGVMRSDILRQTRLQESYTGSDQVLLCELALRGPFYLVPEPLFYKRYHEGNSYRHWRGRMAWSRPDLAESGRPSFPYWLELAGYAKALQRAPLPWRERALCLVWLGRYMLTKWRGLAGDVAAAAVMLLHSKEWRMAQYAPERWM
jgi:glycosyltransferase involved in cell wall biosynthesis